MFSLKKYKRLHFALISEYKKTISQSLLKHILKRLLDEARSPAFINFFCLNQFLVFYKFVERNALTAQRLSRNPLSKQRARS